MMAADPGPILAEIEQALRANDVRRAAELAEAALAAGAEHPLILNLRAFKREAEGRLGEAVADLRRARALAPRDMRLANALGLCLAKMERHGEALAAFDDAIALEPRFAPAHYNRAWVSELAGDLATASAAYERTLELEPGHADAAGSLAFIAARGGDAAKARAFAGRALAVDASQTSAVLALAQVDLAERDFPAAEARLRALLAGDAARLTPNLRSIALGRLADSLDAQGRYPEAFAAYQAEKAEVLRLHAPRFGGTGGSMPVYLRWLSEQFRRARPSDWAAREAAPDASGVTGHVFLVGFPRSGTTLLENVLASHPDIVTLEERETLSDAVADFMSDERGLRRLAAADEAELARHRSLYWDRVRGFGVEPAGKVFVDKLPLNMLKLPVICRLFPRAKVLFAIRDPRDVVLSCFRRHFTINAAMYELLTLEGAARFYDAAMGLFDLYRASLPVEVHPLRYEDLVEDFEAQTRALCGFLGVGWTADLAAFAATARSRAIATPSAAQVARGLYRDGLGQWRRYEAQLQGVAPTLAPWVARFGYDA